MEAVRIASAGYPSRTPYKNFYARYPSPHNASGVVSRLVCQLTRDTRTRPHTHGRYQILKKHEQGEDSRSSCHSLFQALGIQKIEGQFGETKIFLKAGMARLPPPHSRAQHTTHTHTTHASANEWGAWLCFIRSRIWRSCVRTG
jgi:myosin heavy subunit